MNLKEKIVAVTIGIRYARSFRLQDVSGEIIDRVLHDEKSPFSQKSMFDTIEETNTREKKLINSKTDQYLRFNTDDLIFSLSISDDFESKLALIKDKIFPY